MKYKVDWSSPRQGIQSTTVDAINLTAAREQVESMYAHIEGFNAFCVSPVFEKKEYSEPQQSHSSSSSSESSGGGSDDDFSTMIGGGALAAGFFIVLFGLFTLPTGIIAMVIGGAVGWIGWKVACWLSDRGW
jgi:hypothetical protein